jgi:hypothetical protein
MPHHSTLTTTQQPTRELAQMLAALFEPDGLIELRLIESWSENNKQQSRFIQRLWRLPAEIVAAYRELRIQNESGANIYFGVNPRLDRLGTKVAVRSCRCVWADFDHVTVADVERRWQGLLPPPSVLVASGHGVHAYWLLDATFHVGIAVDRERFEQMLQRLYVDLAADSVQDVSRVLRLPPFMNVKGMRNGSAPLPCRLVNCECHRRYPISTFARWLDVANEAHISTGMFPCPNRVAEPDWDRVRRVAQQLDEETADRSRRDFAVVCQLLTLDCSGEEIWQLVRDHSKFATHGERYFQTTLTNARKALGAK